MRIKSIEVQGLFGAFTHKIDLYMEDRITIIHGPNGFGKTTILKLVFALFSANIYQIISIPFSFFRVVMDDESEISIDKSQEDSPITLYFQGKEYPLISGFSSDDFYYISKFIDRELPEFQRIASDAWIYSPTDETLNLVDIIERFGELYPQLRRYVRKEEPEWALELKKILPVRLIQAQRLLTVSESSTKSKHDYKTLAPMVSLYSEELINNINSKLAEYAAFSQSLDQKFASKLIDALQDQKFEPPSNFELIKRFKHIESQRFKLLAAGLLDRGDQEPFELPDKLDKTIKKALVVYFDDMEQKLEILQELAEKIDLFKTVVNNLFVHKKIKISKTNGFQFKTPDRTILEPSKLSSGEQHEIVLLYELLFKAEPNSIILIDEPELSLHVLWQELFLAYLNKITQIAKVDIIVATHSPQIINDRWDLTVELKEEVA